MKRVSIQTLVFSVLALIFILLITFLSSAFPPYPLASYQDAIDLLTPVVLIPMYWVLFRNASSGHTTRAEEIIFMIFAAFWAAGQGMHLAANSINNLIGALAEGQVIDVTATDIHTLTYFYDEHLSHYLWHIGFVGLSAVLVYREWRKPAGETTAWWAVTLAGVIHGFTNFCIFLEGQTVPLGLPFSALFVLFALIAQRKQFTRKPLLAFFFITYLLAFLMLVGWGLYHGGFPQFSDVGLI